MKTDEVLRYLKQSLSGGNYRYHRLNTRYVRISRYGREIVVDLQPMRASLAAFESEVNRIDKALTKEK